jgi:hypothetical protein
VTVEIVKATLRRFFQGPKTGKLETKDGQVYTYKLDDVQNEPLRQLLLSSWEPDLDIPVTVGLYRSAQGLHITHITPAQAVSSPHTTAPLSLPGEPGPYRDAKELHLSGHYGEAKKKFLEAIALGDRKASAVKDLASLYNERGRCHEAITLINQFLLTAELEKEERAKFVNLRENIHARMAKVTPSAAANAFAERIKGILAGTMPTEPKPVPTLGQPPTETLKEFVCVLQDKKSFPLAPLAPVGQQSQLAYPKTESFAAQLRWQVCVATFASGPNQKAIPDKVVKPRVLDGAWVLAVGVEEWQAALPCPCQLQVGDTVYLRDDDILAGPWTVDARDNLVATHGDYVYEWTWSATWNHLDFVDRTFLLEEPPERLASFYDFMGPEHLAGWLQQKLTEAGPDVVEQYKQFSGFCLAALSSPLDVSRWGRLQTLVNKTLPAGVASTREKQMAPAQVTRSGSQHVAWEGPDQEPQTLQMLQLGTLACRHLLVPSPLHSQIWCEGMGEQCEYHLITPSVAWLSLRDAWPEWEWAWNLAHTHSNRLYVVHVEQANLSLLQHWAKPLLNIAHGLTSQLLGFSELPWPANLRVHWSLTSQPEGFPVAPQLRSAFAAIAAGAPLPPSRRPMDKEFPFLSESDVLALAEDSVPNSLENTPLGDYSRAAAQELRRLGHLLDRYQLDPRLARQIRLELPGQYWRLAR